MQTHEEGSARAGSYGVRAAAEGRKYHACSRCGETPSRKSASSAAFVKVVRHGPHEMPARRGSHRRIKQGHASRAPQPERKIHIFYQRQSAKAAEFLEIFRRAKSD